MRVCNLSYLQTDWYIDQLRRPAYDAPAAPIKWNRYEYMTGQNEAIAIRPEMKRQLQELYVKEPEEARKAFGDDPFELKNILKHWVRSANSEFHFIPTDSIVLKIDKEAVKRSGMVLNDSVPDYLHINLRGRNALYKKDLMMLEMLAECNWERPLYFAVTVGRDNYLSLQDNFVQEGLAFRITPYNATRTGNYIDADKMYDNLMNKFKFGGINNPNIYLDETVFRMCLTHRRMFSILAQTLIARGDKERALKVLQKVDKEIPGTTVTYADNLGGTTELANSWIACGKAAKAQELAGILARSASQYLNWYINYSPIGINYNGQECAMHISDLIEAARILEKTKAKNARQVMETAANYYSQLQARGINISPN